MGGVEIGGILVGFSRGAEVAEAATGGAGGTLAGFGGGGVGAEAAMGGAGGTLVGGSGDGAGGDSGFWTAVILVPRQSAI
jgi:hypothetical protein